MKSRRLLAAVRPAPTAAAPGSRSRRVLRAALLAPAAIAAVWGLLLPGASPASASPFPPAPDPALAGTWVNMNPGAANISDIVISQNAGGLMVDAFYNCSQCEEGNVPATIYGTNVNATTGDTFKVNFSPVSSDNDLEVLLGTLNTATQVLTVHEFITVGGGLNSNKFNWVASETFRAGAPITPEVGGKPWASYPRDDAPQPDKSLQNTSWHIKKLNGTLMEIDFLASGNPALSPLSVHVFGQCGSPGMNGPVPCDWGPVLTGSTYGTSVNASTGATTFLAFFQFNLSSRLVYGTLNADGTMTVQDYSEFNTGTGLSNYVETETFVQG
jgi:hypothetical protein